MTTTLSLGALLERDALSARLVAAGLSGEAAAEKAGLFERAAAALEACGIERDASLGAMFVPGRIEVLGKHVDYAGGHSITCAVDRGFALLVQPREDETVQLLRAEAGAGERPAEPDRARFDLDPDLPSTAGHWSDYPMTVARRLARNFPAARRGANIAFASDLPSAAGLSSSSALITATFFALVRVNRLEHEARYRKHLPSFGDLAGYLGAIENGSSIGALAGDRGVGTFGGSQDHTAIIGSRAGALGLFRYCPVRLLRFIDMPEGFTFVVGVSGAEAVKTGEAQRPYNDAATLAADAAAMWREQSGRDDARLKDAIDSSPDAVERLRAALASRPEVLTRFEHFYAENEQIVPAAAEALEHGDVEALGPIVDRSQQLAETQLGNQIPATSHLARSARRLGAAAASAFGAGFGGSAWALMPRDESSAFIERWREDYARHFPREAEHARFFHAEPGPAAFDLAAGPLARLNRR